MFVIRGKSGFKQFSTCPDTFGQEEKHETFTQAEIALDQAKDTLVYEDFEIIETNVIERVKCGSSKHGEVADKMRSYEQQIEILNAQLDVSQQLHKREFDKVRKYEALYGPLE